MRAKIHRARVTEANVNYVGSITLDPLLMKKAKLLPFEQVDVLINPQTNEPQQVTGGGSFSDQQQALALSWGKSVTETVLFGMTAKQVTRKLGGSSDNFKSLDIGAMKMMGASWRIVPGVNFFDSIAAA